MELHDDWLIWDWFCLRAPGFSVDGVARLRADSALALADQLELARRQLDATRAQALDGLTRLPASKQVNKVIRALRRGELPLPTEQLELEAVLASVRTAHEAATAVEHAADQALQADSFAVATRLVESATEPRLHEALLWQNRVAVHGSVASLLRRPADATDSKTREQRRLVASAIQRYCVKNDTIGFFGPVGWARFVDGPRIAWRPGASLVARRKVYFEYWCIDALAQKLARDPELRPHIAPRRIASIWLDGETLHHPNGQQIALPSPYARVLALLDGQRTAGEIARMLVATPDSGLSEEAEVFEMLANLEARKLCTWTLEVPTATFHPERHLRSLLERATGGARERALAELALLEERRAAVAAAAGQPQELDAALGALETTFEELTQTSATRKGGETYAGRTLVFEDCLRDGELELGSMVVQQLSPALSLVLASARWYTYTIARRYEQSFRAIYDELASGGSPVSYVRFREKLVPLFPGAQAAHGIAHEVAEELRVAWEAILAVGDGRERLIERSSEALAPAVAAAFSAPGPGWPSARHHSPDLMIAAASTDALARGEFRIVLGEIHVGFNTVTLPCLLKEHPDPEVLVRAREVDLPAPGIAPVWSKARNRADFFSTSRHDFDLETGETRSARPREQVVAAGACVVEDQAGELVVRSRDDGRVFPLVAFLEHYLIAESFARFRLLERRAHSPRVMIDRVVIQRESWRFGAAALTFASEASDLARFAGARTFARERGIPPRVFVKADAEAKPFFVDFDSPILVEVFARQVKRSQNVVISEMLPELADCWLTDASGARYTSELRVAVRDPREWYGAVKA